MGSPVVVSQWHSATWLRCGAAASAAPRVRVRVRIGVGVGVGVRVRVRVRVRIRVRSPNPNSNPNPNQACGEVAHAGGRPLAVAVAALRTLLGGRAAMAGEPLGVHGQRELRGVSYWENGRRAGVGLVAALVGPIPLASISATCRVRVRVTVRVRVRVRVRASVQAGACGREAYEPHRAHGSQERQGAALARSQQNRACLARRGLTVHAVSARRVLLARESAAWLGRGGCMTTAA